MFKLTPGQGDQIGRFFAQWVFGCFGQLHENCSSSPHFCATLFSSWVYAILATKKGLATFWAKFLQTHLVALSSIKLTLHRIQTIGKISKETFVRFILGKPETTLGSELGCPID
jgi:hypothetical protein